jgi:hypothetical protein
MPERIRKKIHPALKHGAYSAIGLLPGEDETAFAKLHEDLKAELQPIGGLEDDIVATISSLVWRKQNLHTLARAPSARYRFEALVTKKVEEKMFRNFDFRSKGQPNREEFEANRQAAEAEAREELGEDYAFVEMEHVVDLVKCAEAFDRLDALIDRNLKRLMVLKGLKSLQSSQLGAPPAAQPRSLQDLTKEREDRAELHQPEQELFVKTT